MLLLTSAQAIYFIPGSMAVTPPQRWNFHQGNWVYMNKTGFPISISRNYIGIGKNLTYVFNLDNDDQYHVYFYGEWIKTNGTKTDYDVFVYDPDGEYETYHTESAGLIEHLGTTVEQPFFTPRKDGNYSILLINDLKESEGAENGTLMVIEHINVNRLYKDKLYMEGKDPLTEEPRYYTAWVYEFNSSSRRIEIPVDVPETLDMYEVRLYLMANPALNLGSDLLGVPIAWEPGLFGKREKSVGGFNTNFTAYRGNAFDSCEYPGENMLINYTSEYEGNQLYHLVFLAELGYGNLSFIIKTDFTKPSLNVSKPSVALSGEETIITASSDDTESGVESVNTLCSTDGGSSWNSIAMIQTQPRVYTARVPQQLAGTTVLYRVEARDYAGNKAIEDGRYQCKDPSRVKLYLSDSIIMGGESIGVEGSIVPTRAGASVLIQYTNPSGSVVGRTLNADSFGNFSDVFVPTVSGLWKVSASWDGDLVYMGSSNTSNLRVDKRAPSLNMSLSNNRITFGESLGVSGSLSPSIQAAAISLVIIDPVGSETVKSVETSSQGTYSSEFRPDSKGTWTIKAIYVGDALHNSASSSASSFEVVGGFFDWPNLLIIPLALVVAIVIIIVRKTMHTSDYEE